MENIHAYKNSLVKIYRTTALTAMLSLLLSVSHGKATSQVLDRKLSLHLKNVPFEKLLKAIESAAEVKFFYSVEHVDLNEKISVDADDIFLRDLLNELLTPRNIRFRVHDKEGTIMLKKHKPDIKQRASAPSLPVDTQTEISSQAALSIKGKVTDATTGAPLPGVNVLIKGTTTGTTSDADGLFTIEASPRDVLVFSFIGYRSYEVKIDNASFVEVAMDEDVHALGEVTVNAGYWEVKQKDQTGSIARVTADDINKQPVANPFLALQGRMPGVVITPRTGVTGSAQSVQIRGQNSLRSDGNYPLYVIDGVPVDSKPIQSLNSIFVGGVDPLNTLNPENIESIEVLKDADATAIYGSRGANGVVLVTTKKGKQGKSDLDVQVYSGGGQVSRTMKLLNTEQYVAMRNEAFNNDGPAALADLNNPDYAIYFPDLKVWDQHKYTNWQKRLFGGTANILDAQLAYAAGNSTTSFRVSGGYHKESTVFPGDFGYRKGNVGLNVNHSSADNKLKLNISANYGVDRNDLFNNNAVYTALTLSPNAPGYDDQGKLDWTGYDFNLPNPYSQFKLTHRANTATLISSARISYQVIDGVRLSVNTGYTNNNGSEIVNTPLSSMAPGTFSPSNSTFGNRNTSSWLLEPQASYDKSINEHHLSLLAGSTFQSSNTRSSWIQGIGYLNDDLLGSLSGASSVLKLSSDETMYRYAAAFGRIGYNWKEKYFVNLTARRDGSSRFGPNKRFGNFGAIGVAWIFTEESFAKSAERILSFGKLRASYGTTGNDQIGDYGYVSTFTPSSFTYQGSSILIPTALSNRSYAWEVNKKFEAGIELGLFNNRLQLTADYYHNRSSNQLVGYTLPALTGFTSVIANLNATVQNTGVEIIASSKIVDSDVIRWNVSANLTIPKNRLVAFPNLASSSYASQYVVNKSLSIAKVYHYTGVNPQTGFYQFEDADNNNVLNKSDRTRILNLGRRYYGGINNTLKIKSFELAFFVEFVKQYVRGYYSTFLQAPGLPSNQPEAMLHEGRWQSAGDNAPLQKFTNDNASYDYFKNSDANIDNGSFARLKTLTLSYSLPMSALKRMRTKELVLFAHAQNLFLITKYKGLDPEIPGNSQLPQVRMITGGIKFKL